MDKKFEDLQSKFNDLLKKQNSLFQFVAKQTGKNAKKPSKIIKKTKKQKAQEEEKCEDEPFDLKNDEESEAY